MLKNNREFKMKKATGIFLSVLLLPFIFSVAVMFVNDVVANKTEKELSAFPLPEKTQLAESNSVAGKLYGNGRQ